MPIRKYVKDLVMTFSCFFICLETFRTLKKREKTSDYLSPVKVARKHKTIGEWYFILLTNYWGLSPAAPVIYTPGDISLPGTTFSRILRLILLSSYDSRHRWKFCLFVINYLKKEFWNIKINSANIEIFLNQLANRGLLAKLLFDTIINRFFSWWLPICSLM